MKAALLAELERRLEAHETVMVATVLEGPSGGQALLGADGRLIAGGFDAGELADLVAAESRGLVSDLGSGRARLAAGERSWDVFFDVYPPPPQIIIVGAVHVAIHLVAFARRLGFSTIVIDPRTAFATGERFSEADRLIIDWPDAALSGVPITANTYFALLAHDLKIDLPAIDAALASPARYIGALGSKKTHAKRVAALRESGFGEAEIGRIKNPIGLDLGGRKAEEIALAIIAEILAVRHGRS